MAGGYDHENHAHVLLGSFVFWIVLDGKTWQAFKLPNRWNMIKEDQGIWVWKMIMMRPSPQLTSLTLGRVADVQNVFCQLPTHGGRHVSWILHCRCWPSVEFNNPSPRRPVLGSFAIGSKSPGMSWYPKT